MERSAIRERLVLIAIPDCAALHPGYGLFRRDNGMVRLPGSKGQNRIDISAFEIRIFLKDSLSRLASRHQAKNVCDRHPQAANTRTAMHTIGIDRYSLQKV